MKPIEWKPLVKEDFSEAPWMERLVRPLNNAMGQIQAGVSRGMTLGDNLNAEVKTIDVNGGPAASSASWHLVGGTGEPAFQNSWANIGGGEVPTRFRLISGVVYVQLAVAGGSGGTVIFTLPAGFRPAYALPSPPLTNGGTWAIGGVAANGGVSYVLAGAGGDGNVRGTISFPADDAASTGFPVKFTTTVKGKAAGVVVMRATVVNGRDETPVTGIGGAAWDQDGATISLRGVTGISPGASYRLTLLVVGG